MVVRVIHSVVVTFLPLTHSKPHELLGLVVLELMTAERGHPCLGWEESESGTDECTRCSDMLLFWSYAKTSRFCTWSDLKMKQVCPQKPKAVTKRNKKKKKEQRKTSSILAVMQLLELNKVGSVRPTSSKSLEKKCHL